MVMMVMRMMMIAMRMLGEDHGDAILAAMIVMWR